MKTANSHAFLINTLNSKYNIIIVDDSFIVDRWAVSTRHFLGLNSCRWHSRHWWSWSRLKNTLLSFESWHHPKWWWFTWAGCYSCHGGLGKYSPMKLAQSWEPLCVGVPLKDDTMHCHSMYHVVHSRAQTVKSFNCSTRASMGDRQQLIISGLISPDTRPSGSWVRALTEHTVSFINEQQSLASISMGSTLTLWSESWIMRH